MRPIIDAVVDKGSFFEMNANFGRSMIVGLARLEGRAVLLLASDSFHYGGSWTAEACQKVVRWVDFAETFHLPVVYLMDCPGFMIASRPRRPPPSVTACVRCRGQPDHRALVHPSYVRNSFGVRRRGASARRPVLDALRPGHRPIGARCRWKAHRGGLSRDIDAAEDPKAKLKEIEDRLNKLRSPFRSAEKFWVEEIIDPRKTRSLLCEFARLAEPIRTTGPRRICRSGRK